jgi:hypothetical protein
MNLFSLQLMHVPPPPPPYLTIPDLLVLVIFGEKCKVKATSCINSKYEIQLLSPLDSDTYWTSCRKL